ncbi:MAG: flippase-like domain-containing protein, partial [Gammaproteobacteria bacterium]|nr:flippase-like domain-containing protein [Gammaproteobacteria bacterium]
WWLVGVTALAGVVWYFRPDSFLQSLQKVGFVGVAGWLAATIMARMLAAEVSMSLLRTLGYRLSRMQIFLIGWLRTFSNQIVPMTGIAVYVQQIRHQSGASWQDLAAASSQQFFVGAAALGVIGVLATLCNVQVTGNATGPLLVVFSALAGIALASALGVSRVMQKMPRALLRRIAAASESFGKLASNPKLVLSLIGLHSGAILLRGARVWLLFGAVGAGLSWREALLIVALAEATVLIAVTPGGLGIREALIIGGASLLDIPTDISVAVSLIDRLFVVALTGIMAAPSAMYLHHRSSRRPVQE